MLALALPALTGAVVDQVLPTGDVPLLGRAGGGDGMFCSSRCSPRWCAPTCCLHLRTQLDARLTLGFLDHLIHLPFAFFHVRSSGDLIARLNSNATVREILTSGALSALLDGSLATLYLGCCW